MRSARNDRLWCGCHDRGGKRSWKARSWHVTAPIDEITNTTPKQIMQLKLESHYGGGGSVERTVSPGFSSANMGCCVTTVDFSWDFVELELRDFRQNGGLTISSSVPHAVHFTDSIWLLSKHSHSPALCCLEPNARMFTPWSSEVQPNSHSGKLGRDVTECSGVGSQRRTRTIF